MLNIKYDEEFNENSININESNYDNFRSEQF